MRGIREFVAQGSADQFATVAWSDPATGGDGSYYSITPGKYMGGDTITDGSDLGGMVNPSASTLAAASLFGWGAPQPSAPTMSPGTSIAAALSSISSAITRPSPTVHGAPAPTGLAAIFTAKNLALAAAALAAAFAIRRLTR